jgi:hypothetical protein
MMSRLRAWGQICSQLAVALKITLFSISSSFF